MEAFGHSFIRGIAGAYDLSDDALARLSPALAEHYRRAQERWPRVAMSGEEFAEHLATCAPDGPDVAAALEKLHTEDVYLAFACARGDKHALQEFETSIIGHAPKAVSRVDGDPTFVDEVVEELRVRLLVAETGAPRIASYAGRGPLTSWVMVAAMRLAYTFKRRSNQELPCAQPGLDLAMSDDPDLQLLKDQVQTPFAAAFRQSIDSLQPRERNVLRLYLIEEVSAEAIAKMYSVHRATVARWITAARQAVQKSTREKLRASLAIGDSTFESLMRNISSRLDISLFANLEPQ